MTRRERLMASIRGQDVDRPPVCFYEITGYDENPSDNDPFNIYSDPSWEPVIALAKEKTDRIVRRNASFKHEGENRKTHTDIKSRMENGSLYEVHTINAGNRNLTSQTRHDPDVNTVWTIEHLLKDVEDLKAWLTLPDEDIDFSNPDISGFIKAETDLGDTQGSRMKTRP